MICLKRGWLPENNFSWNFPSLGTKIKIHAFYSSLVYIFTCISHLEFDFKHQGFNIGNFGTFGRTQGIRKAVTNYFSLKHGSWLFAQKSLEILSTLSFGTPKWGTQETTHLEAVFLPNYLPTAISRGGSGNVNFLCNTRKTLKRIAVMSSQP